MPTIQEQKLYNELVRRGLPVIQGYCDGYKTVDLAILEVKLYIEVDGMQHYDDAKQIIKDFWRDHYSDKNGFNTLRLTNQIIDNRLIDVAEALEKVVRKQLSEQPVVSIV